MVLSNQAANGGKETPKWLKLGHMILGTLMLLTGLFLMFRSPNGFQAYVFVKLILVLIAMPLGIIGSKKNNVFLTGIATLLVVVVLALGYLKPSATPPGVMTPEDLNAAAATSEESPEEIALKVGKSLYYKRLCNSCHGDDGTAGFQKAKNLQTSVLSDEEVANIIVNGKDLMPENEGLTDSEVDHLVVYAKSLRK